MAADTLFETPEFRRFAERLYLSAHGLKSPVLKLNSIAHWQGVKNHLNLSTNALDQSLCFIFGGYFYNSTTPQLESVEIDHALAAVKSLNCDTALLPTVKHDIDESYLVNRGFLRLPWFVEAIFEIETTVSNDLHRRMGSERFQNQMRVYNLSKSQYNWHWLTAADILKKPNLFEIAANLHSKNAEKYHHTTNLYSEDILLEIFKSEMSSKFTLGLRQDNETGNFVQMALMLEDTVRSQLHLLVQGQDKTESRPRQNLYNALFFDSFNYAEERGLRAVHLGRGNHNLKKQLGANQFNQLDNWVWAADVKLRQQLDLVAAAAHSKLWVDTKSISSQPYFAKVTRPEVTAAKWPYFLNLRQIREQAGFRDLASSVGTLPTKMNTYPNMTPKTLIKKYVGFLKDEFKQKSNGNELAISEENVLITRGSTEAIDLLIRSVCRRTVDSVVITPPTFPLYEYWAKLFDVKVECVPLIGENFERLDIERIKFFAAKICFLCSPNNPTGQAVPLNELAELAGTLPKTLFAIDEAYAEFDTLPSAISLFEKYRNIVVFRSFSKAWSLSALRAGALVADSGIVNAARISQGPFGTPTFVEDTLSKQLNRLKPLYDRIDATRAEVKHFSNELKSLPIVGRIFKSSANFICVEFVDVDLVYKTLIANKVLVERVAAPLDNALRISVQFSPDTDRVLKVLKQIQK